MSFSSVKLVYFSPTGTTKKVLESIAEGIGIQPVQHISLTLPDESTNAFTSFTDELVVIGAPVYVGRLPVDAVKRFKRLRAHGTRAFVVVVYGNRNYEDALLELVDLSQELGFIPIAAAAFIGEHSFSTREVPIAAGRPDEDDLEKAIEFGRAINQKMSSESTISPKVPGKFPYKDLMPSFQGSAETLAEICTTCGTCAQVCPKRAITVTTEVKTDSSLCIKCCACVKGCPTHARIMDIPHIKKIAAWLNEHYSSRKEPEYFP